MDKELAAQILREKIADPIPTLYWLIQEADRMINYGDSAYSFDDLLIGYFGKEAFDEAHKIHMDGNGSNTYST